MDHDCLTQAALDGFPGVVAVLDDRLRLRVATGALLPALSGSQHPIGLPSKLATHAMALASRVENGGAAACTAFVAAAGCSWRRTRWSRAATPCTRPRPTRWTVVRFTISLSEAAHRQAAGEGLVALT